MVMHKTQWPSRQEFPTAQRRSLSMWAVWSTIASSGVCASIDPSQPSHPGHHGDFTYYTSGAFELDLSENTINKYGQESIGQSDSTSTGELPRPLQRHEQSASSSLIQSEFLYGDPMVMDQSSLTTDDSGSDSGCFLSTHAVMDGDDDCFDSSAPPVANDDFSSSFWTSSLDKKFMASNKDLLREIEEAMEKAAEDNDEDDDDDDGHSSMLSNASFRRRVSSSSSYSVATSDNRDHNRINKKIQKLSSSTRNTATNNKHRGALPVTLNSVILNVRGGGIGGGSGGMMTSALFSSEISKKLVTTALVTLVFEAMIGHILEFLKIVMQTSDTTYWKVLQQITAEKGIFGLWDGFCPWGIVQALGKGAVFGLAHAAAAGVLVPFSNSHKWLPMPLALTLAGGIGGGFQGYVLSPTLLLKTRVMTNPAFREKMSVWSTTLLSFRLGWDVVQKEGVATLMKGSNVFATKRVFDWSSRYFFADLFESFFLQLKNGQPLTVAEKSASSLLGGVASTCVTLPLDVLVAKTQDAKKAGVRVSALRLFQDELKEKGLSGLKDAYMRGFEARLLHVCLTTVVVKTFTPIAYEAFFGVSSAKA